MAVHRSALPYVDSELDALPGMREAVDAMVEEEMAVIAKEGVPDYAARFRDVAGTAFKRTPLMTAEMKRVAKGEKLIFDTSNYDMLQPSVQDRKDPQAWQKCVKNARAQLEHQSNRIANLELLTAYGGQAWTTHKDDLTKMEENMRRFLDEMQARLQNLNWERQQEQLDAGNDLYELEVRWGELVSKNFQLEMACAALQAQVDQAENQA